MKPSSHDPRFPPPLGPLPPNILFPRRAREPTVTTPVTPHRHTRRARVALFFSRRHSLIFGFLWFHCGVRLWLGKSFSPGTTSFLVFFTPFPLFSSSSSSSFARFLSFFASFYRVPSIIQPNHRPPLPWFFLLILFHFFAGSTVFVRRYCRGSSQNCRPRFLEQAKDSQGRKPCNASDISNSPSPAQISIRRFEKQI